MIVLQTIVASILFTLALISGGAASAADAADIQNSLDTGICDQLQSVISDYCDNLELLRNSLAACAVSSYSSTLCTMYVAMLIQ